MIRKILLILSVFLLLTLVACNNAEENDFEEITVNESEDVLEETSEVENSNDEPSEELSEKKESVFDIDVDLIQKMDDDSAYLYIMSKSEVDKNSFKNEKLTDKEKAGKFCIDFMRNLLHMDCEKIVDSLDEIIYEGEEPMSKLYAQKEMMPYCGKGAGEFIDIEKYLEEVTLSVLDKKEFDYVLSLNEEEFFIDFTEDEYFCSFIYFEQSYSNGDLDETFLVVTERGDEFKLLALPR